VNNLSFYLIKRSLTNSDTVVAIELREDRNPNSLAPLSPPYLYFVLSTVPLRITYVSRASNQYKVINSLFFDNTEGDYQIRELNEVEVSLLKTALQQPLQEVWSKVVRTLETEGVEKAREQLEEEIARYKVKKFMGWE